MVNGGRCWGKGRRENLVLRIFVTDVIVEFLEKNDERTVGRVRPKTEVDWGFSR